MIDNQVAKWVNRNADEYNRNRINKLHQFNMKATSLQDDDFPNYLAWVYWCREMADLLKEHTGLPWRPRDVEMAVFTSQRAGIKLEVL